MRVEPAAITPARVVHQEGVVALLAVVALWWSAQRPWEALAPQPDLVRSLGLGIAAGGGMALLLRLLGRFPAVRRLEDWQRELFTGWSTGDVLLVALVSAAAEEALLRAALQPQIGLVPAAVLFALLHVIPDRRLWFWPVMALVLGLALGLLYDHGGYPAATAAHFVVNGVGLHRLRR